MRKPPPPTQFAPKISSAQQAAGRAIGFASAQTKAAVASPSAPLPPPTRFGPPATAAQPMYRVNNRAVFTTSKGSRYTVTHGGLRREKYNGAVSEGAKNIFYVDYQESDEILADSGAMSGARVIKDSNRYYLVYTINSVAKRFRIHREPKVGYAPLDLILPQDGSIGDLGTARFHIGDKITDIVWRPQR